MSVCVSVCVCGVCVCGVCVCVCVDVREHSDVRASAQVLGKGR